MKRIHRSQIVVKWWLVLCALTLYWTCPSSEGQEKRPEAGERPSPAWQDTVSTAEDRTGKAYGRAWLLGGRDGTLRDSGKADLRNLAEGCFQKAVVQIDASSLASVRQHFTRTSRFVKVQPDSRYTLIVEVKGKGDGYASAGVRWAHPDAPPGLVDKDEFLTVVKPSGKWTAHSFTFASDPDSKASSVQILLKAHGPVTASFRKVRLVPGWWADTRWRFKRPYKPGARPW